MPTNCLEVNIDIDVKNSEKKFVCKDCNKSFKDKYRLSRHEKNHVNEQQSELPEVLSDDQEDDIKGPEDDIKEPVMTSDLADFDTYRFEFIEIGMIF